MAGVTLGRGSDVLGWFISGSDAVASRAGARLDAGVAEACWFPGSSAMTHVTLGRGGDVLRWFTGGSDAMTSAASAGADAYMRETRKGPRNRGCMAAFTRQRGRHMVFRFARTGYAISGAVAAATLGGRALEDPLHVTVLAFLAGMHAVQGKAGFQMIEVRAFFGFRHGIGRHAQQHKSQ